MADRPSDQDVVGVTTVVVVVGGGGGGGGSDTGAVRPSQAKTMQCVSLGDFEHRQDRKVVGTDYVPP